MTCDMSDAKLHTDSSQSETANGPLAMSSPQPNLKKKKTWQSPFKVPDDNSIFLQSMREKEERKEEMRKHLALPLHEKMTHTARMVDKMRRELAQQQGVEEEEEEAKMKNPQQNKSKRGDPKHLSGKSDLKMAMIRQENIKRESKMDFISMERQKHLLEFSLSMKKSEIMQMDEVIAEDDRRLKEAERMIERDNRIFAEFLKENERKIVEARTISEQAAKSKQEKNAEIKRLAAEIGTKKSEIAKDEEILKDYKRYKNLLFMLSPPEWQEAQEVKAMKAKARCDTDAQQEHNKDTEESAGLEHKASGLSRELPPIREPRLSSAHSDTLIADSELDSDSSEYEDEPELYFSDPQQLLDLLKELTEQNLSLIQNSARLNERVKEQQQTIETTRKESEQEEEQLRLQMSDVRQRINKEKTRAAKLEQKVLLYDCMKSNNEDQEIMMDAVGLKVADVFHCCVDDRITNLRTFEMLAKIENCVSLLQESLEKVPAETLDIIRKIKDKERRTREREEQLSQQRAKREEKMKKYVERSMADIQKKSGRKLMPRCLPMKQKVKVKEVVDTSAEDELHDYLFSHSP